MFQPKKFFFHDLQPPQTRARGPPAAILHQMIFKDRRHTECAVVMDIPSKERLYCDWGQLPLPFPALGKCCGAEVSFPKV